MPGEHRADEGDHPPTTFRRVTSGLFEIKWDGVAAPIAFVEDEEVRLPIAAPASPASGSIPELGRDCHTNSPADTAVLDGEIAVLDPKGRVRSFQPDSSRASPNTDPNSIAQTFPVPQPVVYFAFDLLYLKRLRSVQCGARHAQGNCLNRC